MKKYHSSHPKNINYSTVDIHYLHEKYKIVLGVNSMTKNTKFFTKDKEVIGELIDEKSLSFFEKTCAKWNSNKEKRIGVQFNTTELTIPIDINILGFKYHFDDIEKNLGDVDFNFFTTNAIISSKIFYTPTLGFFKINKFLLTFRELAKKKFIIDIFNIKLKFSITLVHDNVGYTFYPVTLEGKTYLKFSSNLMIKNKDIKKFNSFISSNTFLLLKNVYTYRSFLVIRKVKFIFEVDFKNIM